MHVHNRRLPGVMRAERLSAQYLLCFYRTPIEEEEEEEEELY